ncbi:hypothetical protein BB559_002491 [Furculomyces boomerangus]|uniref:Thioredoxin-like fold domain-containing protein n=2 Tax=Harpellales TaxID=61421 RepID=A0A2T9YV28_9FUNG|nr:hypothetical protein BB559_002491 [Furculomyces boomerangus]PWA02394.1 hypothetical protein BB558_001485 [Smittium angustum]
MLNTKTEQIYTRNIYLECFDSEQTAVNTDAYQVKQRKQSLSIKKSYTYPDVILDTYKSTIVNNSIKNDSQTSIDSNKTIRYSNDLTPITHNLSLHQNELNLSKKSPIFDESSSSTTTLIGLRRKLSTKVSPLQSIPVYRGRYSVSTDTSSATTPISAMAIRRFSIKSKKTNTQDMNIKISKDAAKESAYKLMLNGDDMLSYFDGLIACNGEFVTDRLSLLGGKNIAVYFSDCDSSQVTWTTAKLLELCKYKKDDTVFIYIPINQSFEDMKTVLEETGVYSIPSFKHRTINMLCAKYKINTFPTLMIIDKDSTRKTLPTIHFGSEKICSLVDSEIPSEYSLDIQNPEVKQQQTEKILKWFKIGPWK